MKFTLLTALAAAKMKIAAVGDSITEGSHSTAENDYPSQLQRMLNSDEYEVKNFGLGMRCVIKECNYPYWED